MFEDNSISLTTGRDVAQIHAATCLLMTQFINGHHTPKLAHLIVQQLGRLLSHPELEHSASSRDMYLQLLEHWQTVTGLLLERKAARQQPAATH
ncbi:MULTISPECIES: hypothetical protein [Methylomonas]|uniref:Uncharacterized protein n=2 Tax=Methylomonas TaxID=416 RepID=A0A140E493_9GAMM|nr:MULTISPECIES: hypothetical protein [Methylomonas]AMK75217.1 hypothetical protein JT25_001735 [Methylomonas denitrificans]OAH99387.1 hypothetical protein A1342_04480 [Methylomonas methanica]TCV85035.1 hypothetical protein EDE11_106146 [Methylomonas methanica]